MAAPSQARGAEAPTRGAGAEEGRHQHRPSPPRLSSPSSLHLSHPPRGGGGKVVGPQWGKVDNFSEKGRVDPMIGTRAHLRQVGSDSRFILSNQIQNTLLLWVNVSLVSAQAASTNICFPHANLMRPCAGREGDQGSMPPHLPPPCATRHGGGVRVGGPGPSGSGPGRPDKPPNSPPPCHPLQQHRARQHRRRRPRARQPPQGGRRARRRAATSEVCPAPPRHRRPPLLPIMRNGGG